MPDSKTRTTDLVLEEHDIDITEAMVTIGPDVATLFGPGAVDPGTDANTTTIRMRDRDFVFDDGVVGFHLTGMSVTVTRMTFPGTGLPYLNFFFKYSVTAAGWRSGRGQLHGEVLGVGHGLEFLSRDGGTMWSWGFPADDFVVQCGWNRHPRMHHWIEDRDVSWFESWKQARYAMSGTTLYGC